MYFQPKIRYTNPDAVRTNSIIKYIGNRVINNNKNFLCAVTGPTGIGKSWACGSMSEIYSEMYDIEYLPEYHTFFNLKQLLELVNNKEKYHIKIGTPLSYDESQIQVNVRDWQSEANKILNALVSTFRNDRLVVFFPTPMLKFIDKQSRELFHGEFEVEGFNKKTEITKVKPRFLEHTRFSDEPYRKRLIVEYKTHRKIKYVKYKLQNWNISRPSQSWIDIYERKKKEFTDELKAKLQKRIEKEEEKERDRNETFYKVVELYDKFGEDYIKILKETPEITPHTLEKYIQFIKRSRKKVLKTHS